MTNNVTISIRKRLHTNNIFSDQISLYTRNTLIVSSFVKDRII